MYNLSKNSSEEEILSFSYEQFEKMSVSELNKKISKTKNECDGVNRQNICEHIFFLLKGCNYEKLTIALPIVVLLIMGLAYLFIFNTTERKIYRSLDIDIPFSELTIKEMHNGYGDDFKGDGESLHLITSKQDLIDLNMKIVELADKLGKPVVATTDSHYPDKESAIYRNIVMSRVGFGDTNSNSLYLRTTAEMLKEFDYLGERTKEIVIDNTNLIAAMTEEFQPVPDEKCPPSIDGADETLRSTCYANARRIYGEPLPEEIRERLDTELNSIISNGYAVMYVAAQLLVEKSIKTVTW